METGEDVAMERRETYRTVFRLPRPATIDINGAPCDAEMIDLSENGAKFRCPVALDGPMPRRDGDTVCSIRLESGAVTRIKGSIRWTMRYPEGVTLGVRFTGGLDAALTCLLGDATGPMAS